MKQLFGLNQVSSTTPLWAKWFFRIIFLLTKIATGYVAATNLISQENKYEITLFLTLIIDPLAFGFSKLFGMREEQEEEEVIKMLGIGGSNPPQKNPKEK